MHTVTKFLLASISVLFIYAAQGCGGSGSGGSTSYYEPVVAGTQITVNSVSPNAVDVQNGTTFTVKGSGFLIPGEQGSEIYGLVIPAAQSGLTSNPGTINLYNYFAAKATVVSDTVITVTVPPSMNSQTLESLAQNGKAQFYLQFVYGIPPRNNIVTNNYDPLMVAGYFPTTSSAANTIGVTNWL